MLLRTYKISYFFYFRVNKGTLYSNYIITIGVAYPSSYQLIGTLSIQNSESIFEVTLKAILAGKLALLKPVITFTDGLCVAN
jgi:hypothetical protein